MVVFVAAVSWADAEAMKAEKRRVVKFMLEVGSEYGFPEVWG